MPVAVVVESGFRVEVLGGEAVREGVGERVAGGDGAAEGVVGVCGNGRAGGVKVYAATVAPEVSR